MVTAARWPCLEIPTCDRSFVTWPPKLAFSGGDEMCLMGFCKSLCLCCCVLDVCYEYCFVLLVRGHACRCCCRFAHRWKLEIYAWCHQVSQDDKSMKAMPRALEPIYRRWILVTLDRWDTASLSSCMTSTCHLGVCFIFRTWSGLWILWHVFKTCLLFG